MIHFSFSTIQYCLQPENSHNWINKMAKVKKPVFPAMTAGHEGHRIIQDHVSGKKKDPRIDYITEYFPIVEEKSFDERCKIIIRIDDYEVMGFLDGDNPEAKRFLEVKLSGGLNGKDPTPWSLGQFKDSVQRKIYALAREDYPEAVLITGSLDPEHWKNEMTRLKVRRVDNTPQDRADALKWLKDGIAVFENGDFNGGLDDEGRCTMGRMCSYGDNCQFKQF